MKRYSYYLGARPSFLEGDSASYRLRQHLRQVQVLSERRGSGLCRDCKGLGDDWLGFSQCNRRI